MFPECSIFALLTETLTKKRRRMDGGFFEAMCVKALEEGRAYSTDSMLKSVAPDMASVKSSALGYTGASQVLSSIVADVCLASRRACMLGWCQDRAACPRVPWHAGLGGAEGIVSGCVPTNAISKTKLPPSYHFH